MIERIFIKENQTELYSIVDPNDGFLVCIPKNTTLNDFLAITKVEKDSYSANLIKRLYNGLISAQDVCKEYQKYYSKEYDDIVSFLFWKYFVPQDMSERFISQIAPNETLLYGNRYSIVYTFLETEIMSESLKDIIVEVRKNYHENTN